MQRGKFITLEGIDGAGKSSHVAGVVDWLRAQRKADVVMTREPGGTALGEKLRELVLNFDMHAETETLMMFAARCEHVRKVIEPALEQGKWVVSDRFTDATFAYQGGGRALPAQSIAVLEQWVHANLQPDLTLLFDIDPSAARQRVAVSGNDPDRFERERLAFMQRVQAVYRERARQFPARIRLIDAAQPREQVTQAIEAILLTL